MLIYVQYMDKHLYHLSLTAETHTTGRHDVRASLPSAQPSIGEMLHAWSCLLTVTRKARSCLQMSDVEPTSLGGVKWLKSQPREIPLRYTDRWASLIFPQSSSSLASNPQFLSHGLWACRAPNASSDSIHQNTPAANGSFPAHPLVVSSLRRISSVEVGAPPWLNHGGPWGRPRGFPDRKTPNTEQATRLAEDLVGASGRAAHHEPSQQGAEESSGASVREGCGCARRSVTNRFFHLPVADVVISIEKQG
jgi:hypothetical protein